MKHAAPVCWQELVENFRNKVEDTFDQLADAIKDTILDWGCDDEGAPPGPELPPLSRESLVAELRPRVEEILGRVADVLNGASTGDVDAAEEQVARLFAELARDALLAALRMRSDGPAPTRAAIDEPRGEWARRYRRMHAGSAAAGPARFTAPPIEEIDPGVLGWAGAGGGGRGTPVAGEMPEEDS